VVKEVEATVESRNAKIAREVKAKITSNSFSTASVTGKAGMFDISNIDGLDYTVGGALKGFWFREESSRLQMAKAMGYLFPDEISSEFKRQRLGDLTLMLQTEEARANYKHMIEQKNRNWEGNTMERDERVRNNKAFVEFEKESVVIGIK